MRAQDNLAAWDEIAGTHASTIPTSFVRHIDRSRGANRVLDLGCGYGRVLAELRAAGIGPAFGVDGSPVMCSRAVAAGFPVTAALATCLPFAASSFDTVLCIAVLNSVPTRPERVSVFAEIARVLAPGGRAIVADFTRTYSPRRVARYLLNLPRTKRWGCFASDGIEFYHPSQGQLAGEMQRAGLELVSVERQSYTTMHGNASNGVVVVGVR